MPTPADRFIAAAATPFADNPELDIAARNELKNSIANAGEARGDSLDRAALRLETAGRTAKWIRLSLYAGTLLLSLVVWGDFARSAITFRAGYSMLTGLGTGIANPEAMEKRLIAGKTPEERLILVGDTSKRSRSERMKALWESDPDNPVYYSEYATVHGSEHGVLPPDFTATGRRLDPGNAWFPAIAAGVAARESLDDTKKPVVTPGGAKLMGLRDQAKLDEAIALLQEAARAERFESHSSELLVKRIALLPPRTDAMEQMVPISYVAGMSTLSLRMRRIGEAVSLKAHQLAKAADAEGFRQLVADWENFSRLISSARYVNLVDMLVTVVVARGPLKALVEAAKDLGLPEEEKRLKEREDRFAAWKTAASGRAHDTRSLDLHGSLLAKTALGVAGRQTRDIVPITNEELKPGRIADHALAGRLVGFLAWLLLGSVLLASLLYRFRASKLIRRLSDRMLGLMKPVDWMWIIAGGVILPLAFHQFIQRLTPLGGREWSLAASSFTAPSGQAGATLWLMVFLPLLIARWRLSLRAGAIGLESRTRIWTWICVVVGFAALPVFGAAFLSGAPSMPTLGAAGTMLGLLKLCVLIIGIRAIFGRRSQLLRRVTLSRILIPAYATGMLLMMVTVLVYHAEEKYWIARDALTGMSIAKPGMTSYEYDVTQQLRRELLEILNPGHE
jgi:hypothetical protein